MNDTLFAKSFSFIEFHRGKRAFTDMKNGSPKHFLAYMLRGKCRITSAEGEIRAEEGEAFYIPKGLVYRSYWQDSKDVTFLSLGFPYLSCTEQKSYPLQVLPLDDALKSLFFAVPIGTRTQAAGIGALYTLLAGLLPLMRESEPCRSRRIVALCEQLLFENTALRPAELARAAGVCESALYAAFDKVGEETPHEMRARILFEKAKELLLTTDLPIEHIADRLGFCSCTYFRKKFKEHFLLSPREMRKSGIVL